jgi:hypothetical protein
MYLQSIHQDLTAASLLEHVSTALRKTIT